MSVNWLSSLGYIFEIQKHQMILNPVRRRGIEIRAHAMTHVEYYSLAYA